MNMIYSFVVRVFGCICFIGLLAGCDPAETPPPEPKVVRKKVAPPPERLARAPETREDQEESPASPIAKEGDSETESEPVAMADPKTVPDPSEEGASEAEESVVPPPANDEADSETAESAVEVADGRPEAEAEAPSDAEMDEGEEGEATEADSDSDAGAEIAGMDLPGTLVAYNPEGRVDPFEPLFREEPERREPEKTEKEEKPERPQRRLTPLERLELSQLKLVGIIRSPSGDRALVEEASGKGYIITRGTYIGIHSGQVVEIQEDGIIVEERHEDVYGDVDIRRRELKFQRPSGDEIL
ncbi:MAG: pilus assembly protein PilP [Desulfococcaceae bacterium]